MTVSGVGVRAESVGDGLGRLGVTKREAQVLSLVVARYDNSDIASRLEVSKRTVESHIAALLRKLAAPDRKALIGRGAWLGRPSLGPTEGSRHGDDPVRIVAARERAASARRRSMAAHKRAATLHNAAAVQLARLGNSAAAARAAGRAAKERRLSELALAQLVELDSLAAQTA